MTTRRSDSGESPNRFTVNGQVNGHADRDDSIFASHYKITPLLTCVESLIHVTPLKGGL